MQLAAIDIDGSRFRSRRAELQILAVQAPERMRPLHGAQFRADIDRIGNSWFSRKRCASNPCLSIPLRQSWCKHCRRSWRRRVSERLAGPANGSRPRCKVDNGWLIHSFTKHLLARVVPIADWAPPP